MNEQRVATIRARLTEAFAPSRLDVEDDSARHAGHAGARSGGGHFNVTIVSTAFTGAGLLQRHRMIYDALGDAMSRDIHALSIKAYSPDENQSDP
jgi:BolA protein